MKQNHFVITLSKISGKETSREIIDLHIEHLRKLDKQGRLVLAGPFTDHPSGLVVVRALTKEEAVSIANEDPFVCGGVRSFEVKTLQLANAQNNYLG